MCVVQGGGAVCQPGANATRLPRCTTMPSACGATSGTTLWVDMSGVTGAPAAAGSLRFGEVGGLIVPAVAVGPEPLLSATCPQVSAPCPQRASPALRWAPSCILLFMRIRLPLLIQ